MGQLLHSLQLGFSVASHLSDSTTAKFLYLSQGTQTRIELAFSEVTLTSTTAGENGALCSDNYVLLSEVQASRLPAPAAVKPHSSSYSLPYSAMAAGDCGDQFLYS